MKIDFKNVTDFRKPLVQLPSTFINRPKYILYIYRSLNIYKNDCIW